MSTEKVVTAAALYAALKLGKANGQSVKTLASLLGTTERAIRNLADDLIDADASVCAHPATGYYIAQTYEEAKATRDFLVGRGWHSIKKGNKVLANFTGEGEVDFDELEQSGAFEL